MIFDVVCYGFMRLSVCPPPEAEEKNLTLNPMPSYYTCFVRKYCIHLWCKQHILLQFKHFFYFLLLLLFIYLFLLSYRHFDGYGRRGIFGIDLTLETEGEISVGMPVYAELGQ